MYVHIDSDCGRRQQWRAEDKCKQEFTHLLLISALLQDTALPVNYFPGDDVARVPVNSWRPFAYLLMANWLNDLYRDTPYALESLKG